MRRSVPLLVPPNTQDTSMTLDEHLELGSFISTRVQDDDEEDPPLKDCLSSRSIDCARLCLKAAGLRDDESIDEARNVEGGWIWDDEVGGAKVVRTFTEMVSRTWT
ncbi:hypothetical protein ACM66B_004158 [Microbotryomycetes sp. NB124-2]